MKASTANAPRRVFLQSTTLAGAGFFLLSCGGEKSQPQVAAEQQTEAKKLGEELGGEVTATEDLMREHGVLRRALLVYTAAAAKLRGNPASVPPDALTRTARLFRAFGEDYHERRLEEAYIFPAVRRAGSAAGGLADILLIQHGRGREITDFILAVSQGAKLGANADALAQALESLVLMYRHHAAREDTVIFPAWKQTLSATQLDEMNDKFEDIEHEVFGEDGYENAVKQIAEIESMLGVAAISQFTAPPPPKPEV